MKKTKIYLKTTFISILEHDKRILQLMSVDFVFSYFVGMRETMVVLFIAFGTRDRLRSAHCHSEIPGHLEFGNFLTHHYAEKDTRRIRTFLSIRGCRKDG